MAEGRRTPDSPVNDGHRAMMDRAEASSRAREEHLSPRGKGKGKGKANKEKYEQSPTLFVSPPPSTFLCPFPGNHLLNDPVIRRCGHTFCRSCVASASTCPVDNTSLEGDKDISNVALAELVGRVLVYCRYGVREVDGKLEPCQNMCEAQILHSEKEDHEKSCGYRPVICTHCNDSGLNLLAKDLEEHQVQCDNVPCPNKKYGCSYKGVVNRVKKHRETKCDHERFRKYFEEIEMKMIEMEQESSRTLQEVEAYYEDRMQRQQDVILALVDDVKKLSVEVIHMRELLARRTGRSLTQSRDSPGTPSRHKNLGFATSSNQLPRHHPPPFATLEKGRSTSVSQPIMKTRQTGDDRASDRSYSIEPMIAPDSPVALRDPTPYHVIPRRPSVAIPATPPHELSGSSNSAFLDTEGAPDLFMGHAKMCFLGSLIGHEGPVWGLAAVDNEMLVSGSSDGTVKLWRLQDRVCVHSFVGHEGNVHAVVVRDGSIYSGSSDFTIKVWSIESKKCTHTLQGQNIICSLVLSPNSLFSGSYKEIKVWNLATNELLRTLKGHNHWVRALTVHGQKLYSGSYNNIKIWDVDSLACLKSFDTPGGRYTDHSQFMIFP